MVKLTSTPGARSSCRGSDSKNLCSRSRPALFRAARRGKIAASSKYALPRPALLSTCAQPLSDATILRKPDGSDRRRAFLRTVRNEPVLEVYLIRKVLKSVPFESRQFFICQRRLQYLHFGLNSTVIAAIACAGKLAFKNTEPSRKLTGCFSLTTCDASSNRSTSLRLRYSGWPISSTRFGLA